MEVPLGSLNFSVTFAFAKIPQTLLEMDIGRKFKDLEMCNWSCKMSESFEDETKYEQNVSQNILNKSPEDCEREAKKESLDDSRSGIDNANLLGDSSLIIENTCQLNCVSSSENTEKTHNLELDTYLEILEGSGLPLLRRKGTNMTFSPNYYVQTALRGCLYNTHVVSCTSPKWNYATDLKISPQDLKEVSVTSLLFNAFIFCVSFLIYSFVC